MLDAQRRTASSMTIDRRLVRRTLTACHVLRPAPGARRSHRRQLAAQLFEVEVRLHAQDRVGSECDEFTTRPAHTTLRCRRPVEVACVRAFQHPDPYALRRGNASQCGRLPDHVGEAGPKRLKDFLQLLLPGRRRGARVVVHTLLSEGLSVGVQVMTAERSHIRVNDLRNGPVEGLPQGRNGGCHGTKSLRSLSAPPGTAEIRSSRMYLGRHAGLRYRSRTACSTEAVGLALGPLQATLLVSLFPPPGLSDGASRQRDQRGGIDAVSELAGATSWATQRTGSRRGSVTEMWIARTPSSMWRSSSARSTSGLACSTNCLVMTRSLIGTLSAWSLTPAERRGLRCG